MNTSELTDLHNRRANIKVVAARCREHAYPLLAWPEDKALLRIADLPRLAHAGAFNQPIAWDRCEFKRLVIVPDDIALRETLHEGRAYAVVINLGQFAGTTIAEYEVESHGDVKNALRDCALSVLRTYGVGSR